MSQPEFDQTRGPPGTPVEVPLIERSNSPSSSVPKGPLESADGSSSWLSSTPAKVALAVGGASLLLIGGVALSGASPMEGVKWLEGQIQDAAKAAEDAGPLGPVYFALIYIVCTILVLPASFLTILAGYIFGAVKGTAVVSVASTTGAALAFLIARYAARPLVTRQLAKYNKVETVDRAIAQDGWKIVFLWRLSPLFPFSASNYMFGLTGVNFWPYVASSWVAMLPATFTYVYLGSLGRATVDAISSDAESQVQPFKIALYVVGAAATILVTREVSSRATKALKQAEEAES